VHAALKAVDHQMAVVHVDRNAMKMRSELTGRLFLGAKLCASQTISMKR
jgi:hypothetical protein